MKFFIVLALCVAVASARFIIPDVSVDEVDEIKDILAAINHPSTDPTTAATLQQLLNDILGIQVGPAIVGPALVDETPIEPSPVVVQENEESPIHVDPVIIDEQTPSDSPLVQIIVNVNSGASVGSPVVVKDPEPTPVIIDESPEVIIEQPIINAPIFPSPVVAPDDLN